MVRCICFHHHPEVWDPVAKYWGCGECILQSSECGHFPLAEIPRCGLLCHGTTSFLSFSCLCLSPAPSLSPSDSICPCLPAFHCLCSNSKVYLCNYATSVFRLASD